MTCCPICSINSSNTFTLGWKFEIYMNRIWRWRKSPFLNILSQFWENRLTNCSVKKLTLGSLSKIARLKFSCWYWKITSEAVSIRCLSLVQYWLFSLICGIPILSHHLWNPFPWNKRNLERSFWTTVILDKGHFGQRSFRTTVILDIGHFG